MIKKDTVKKYLDDLASDAATPGGGSAAGVIASTGVSLALMAINISKNRKSFADYSEGEHNEVAESVTRLEDTRLKMLLIADKDEEVFHKFMLAFHSKDEKKIALATSECFDVPYRLTLLCFDALAEVNTISPYVVDSVSSDLKMSYIFLRAALESCDVNMKINLTKYIDSASKTKYKNIHKMIKASLK